VRLEERRTLKLVLGGGIAAVLLPVVYLAALFVFGVSLVPGPVPDTAPPPPMMARALWARAEGGRATELQPITPVNVAGYVICMELAALVEEPAARAAKRAGCARWLPAMRGLEYLSTLHVQAHGVPRASFRGGAGSFATTLRVAYSWTRDDVVNTLAARADFGERWRGIDAAAAGYFGKTVDALTLGEVAFLATRVANTGTDPWCEPDVALAQRNRVLKQMQDDGAIAEPEFSEASASALVLAAPPSDHPSCK
jgi:hypothetical protein